VLALRKEFLSPRSSPTTSGRDDVEGKGQYLFDDKGRRYLDAFAGVVTVTSGIVIRM